VTSYPGLGFDPTPGEPGDVQSVLQAFADTGGKVGLMIATLQDTLDVSDGWIGDAADDFHDNGDDLPQALQKGAESMQQAADALITWFCQLTGNKQQAEALDRIARELKKELAAAEQDLAAAASGARMATGSEAAGARRAYQAAATQVGSLHAQLDAVLDEARKLQRRHLDQAEATAAKLRGATGDAFEPVGGGAQVIGAVSGVMSEVSAWTGRAAFVAALVPGGQLAAGVLAATAAGTGVAGAGGSVYAKTQGVPNMANRSYLSLGVDGVLSLGGPAGRTTTQLVKALRAPRRSLATAAATAAIGRGELARELARRGGRAAFDDSTLGKAVLAYRQAHGADSVSTAMRRIGEIRAREAAERGAIGNAVEGTRHGAESAFSLADYGQRATGGDPLGPGEKRVPKLLNPGEFVSDLVNERTRDGLDRVGGRDGKR
jgi:uncharacterized protein YukE